MDYVSVLAGEIGSESRTRKINNMLDVIDKKVSELRDKNHEQLKVTSRKLALALNWNQSVIVRNGYPDFFEEAFDSIEYKEQKGIFIDIEEYVEERKEQREKLAERKEENNQ